MNNINNPDDVIGVCSECNSDQPMSYMEKSPFAQAGQPVPFKFCGVIVLITYRETRNNTIDSSNKGRGIN